MLLRKAVIRNVRSFLEPQELVLDGPVSILIGPNGGGKTNILDALIVMLRRYLFASMYPAHAPTPEQPDRYEFRYNDVLHQMRLERHTDARNDEQVIEVEIEVTEQDLESMRVMQVDAQRLSMLASKKYVNLTLIQATSWKVDQLHAGQRLTYRLRNDNLEIVDGEPGSTFHQYLQRFELDASLRDEFELSALATPLIYLPVNRAAGGFQSTIELAGFSPFETKRQVDAMSSRHHASVVNLAIGRLAQKYRLLLERDKGTAKSEFYEDPSLRELSRLLANLGYEWSLTSLNPLKNQYDVELKKQGTAFAVSAASSGERELLTYLFAIFALNVRNALIIVDEPELHLHPRWQRTLVSLFEELGKSTGNQFVLATHSPTFITPESIVRVSRVYTDAQRSRIARLSAAGLPDAKQLMNIVNSQNNERVFFADEVVLVEGLSDRIFFEAILDSCGAARAGSKIVEVVSVGGKGFFQAYAKVLNAASVPFWTIADLDYVEQVGSEAVKRLFVTDSGEIKKDVLENIKSKDGDSLVLAIDTAIKTGEWGDAVSVWEYIKSWRRVLKPTLTPEEASVLEDFIESQVADGLFILRLGPLEAYLPEGFRGKNLNKLIQFVADRSFFNSLPTDGKAELGNLARTILVNERRHFPARPRSEAVAQGGSAS